MNAHPYVISLLLTLAFGISSLKVKPFKEEGGKLELAKQGCYVVDCSKLENNTHKYCNPYTCTSERVKPLKAYFNVAEYRAQGVTEGVFKWKRMSPPYSFSKFNYTVEINTIQKDFGTIDGCSSEPGWKSIPLVFDADEIIVTWEAKGPGWLLIGKDNCDPSSTDSYIKIDLPDTNPSTTSKIKENESKGIKDEL